MIASPLDSTKSTAKRAGPEISSFEPSKRKQSQTSDNLVNRNFSKPKQLFTRVPMGDILSMCGIINKSCNIFDEIFIQDEFPSVISEGAGKPTSSTSQYLHKQTLLDGLSFQKSASDSIISNESPISRSKLQDYLPTSSQRTSAYLETCEEQPADYQSGVQHRLPCSFLTESHANLLKSVFEVPDDEIIDNDDEEEKFAFVEVGDLID